MILADLSPQDDEMSAPYHGSPKRKSAVAPEDRPFIAWDGEGINIDGEGKPQSYVLFGCSESKIKRSRGLRCFELLDYIISVGIKYPTAFHVGFAFNYDSNMIVRTLRTDKLQELHDKGRVYVRNRAGDRYLIAYTPGKFFRVTKYGRNYNREHNATDKVTVKIEDIFSFFATSFIKAYEDLVGPAPDILVSGKAKRKTFTVEDLETGLIDRYWDLEIQLLRQLADELRKRLYSAGLKITDWYGPGALASLAMKQHGVKQHMSIADDAVREAARYAYAGGRFELYKLGRIKGRVFSLDINSAYPSAITELPSLSEGEWRYVKYDRNPKRLAKFGVYHVRCERGVGFHRVPSPLFHRDYQHNISYPWYVDNWYWSPEVAQALSYPGVSVLEGWEFVGSQTRPFAYVREMYETRRQWKHDGNPAQLALKLCLNSHYGKMAQRVGWTEDDPRIPPWHQLEWAGWITAHTRAKLYSVMRRIPWEHLIAVETDGIYTTYDPALLGIEHSEELGGWEVTEYDEIMYVQSGTAWLHDDKGWHEKRRGLDKDSFTLDQCGQYLKTLQPNERWAPYVGETTRFIGLGAALASRNVKARHCVWETKPREIAPGQHGKRIHISSSCTACAKGATAYDSPHDMVIRSLSMKSIRSVPHDIPWEPTVGDPEWRRAQVEAGERVYD